MEKLPRQRYTKEYRAQAVLLVIGGLFVLNERRAVTRRWLAL